MEWLDKLHVRTVAWLALLGVVAAFGFFPLIFPGFERSDDAKQIDARVTAVNARADQAEVRDKGHQAIDDSKSILQLKAQECTLPKDAPKNVYRQTIIDLNTECITLATAAGKPTKFCDIPACGDL